jgi:mono/diheme cytochrome c family protein
MKKMTALAVVLALAVLLLSGCRTKNVLHRLDPDWNRMQVQPRYDVYEPSDWFEDGMAMRKPPSGSVEYSRASQEPDLAGKVGGAYITSFPIPADRSLLETGRSRFEIICASCHGTIGDGTSVVAAYMGRPPPSLHEARIRDLPHGRIYAVIREGYGFMPSYATHLTPRETWAVIAYVRALQRSQHAVVAELPQPIRSELERAVQ